jgi:hypothetical protein
MRGIGRAVVDHAAFLKHDVAELAKHLGYHQSLFRLRYA